MNRVGRMLVTALLLGFAATVAAHEGRANKGKPVEGEVKTVAGDRLTLQAGSTTVTVMIDDKTKLERGEEPAAKADLKPGDHLSVFGTRLGTGELVASEIVIGETHDAGKSDHMESDMPMRHSH